MQNLQFETKKESILKKEVGIEMLKIDILYPYFAFDDGNGTKVGDVNGFYEEMAKNCKNYAENELFDRIRLEYENDPDPKKRFYFKKYIYRTEYKIKEENDGQTKVIFVIDLIRGGKKINSEIVSLIWDLEKALIYPPKKNKVRKTNANNLTKKEI